MSEIPNLEQMLKLWSKKDLWNRIQEKQARIYELEGKLKNAIIPKFNIGQEVWFIYDEKDDGNYTILNKKVMAFSFSNYGVNYFEFAMSDDGTGNTIWYGYIDSKYVFATKEEAEQKLKQLTHQHEDKGE